MKKHLKLKYETDQLTTKSLDSFAKKYNGLPWKKYGSVHKNSSYKLKIRFHQVTYSLGYDFSLYLFARHLLLPHTDLLLIQSMTVNLISVIGYFTPLSNGVSCFKLISFVFQYSVHSNLVFSCILFSIIKFRYKKQKNT